MRVGQQHQFLLSGQTSGSSQPDSVLCRYMTSPGFNAIGPPPSGRFKSTGTNPSGPIGEQRAGTQPRTGGGSPSSPRIPPRNDAALPLRSQMSPAAASPALQAGALSSWPSLPEQPTRQLPPQEPPQPQPPPERHPHPAPGARGLASPEARTPARRSQICPMPSSGIDQPTAWDPLSVLAEQTMAHIGTIEPTREPCQTRSPAGSGR